MKIQQFHLIISGKVQNVMMREHIRKSASLHNISGWVKNKKDGTVEVIAKGREIDMEKFVALCKRGPFLAHVQDVKIEEQPLDEDLEGFQIRQL